MKPIAISLSPNTDGKDIRGAVRTLISPSLWRDEPVLQNVKRQIATLLGGGNVVLTTSGRQALYDILRASGIGSGDEVILQAFTCIAVPESIIWTGAKPVYADIDSTTYNLTSQSVQARISEKTKAIIVQHTFGIPADIEELVRIAHEKNILLIEDCAVSLGGMHSGKPLGSFGDAAILSFGRDKVVSSVFGGAAVVKSEELYRTLRGYEEARTYPSFSWTLQQLLHPILFSIILPTYSFGIGKLLLLVAQKGGLLSKAYESGERSGEKPSHLEWKFPPVLAHLVHAQFSKFGAMQGRRAEVAARYSAGISNPDTVHAEPSTMSRPGWLRYPLRVSSKKDFLAKAKRAGMILGDWYDAPLTPKNSDMSAFGYTNGMCSVAEDVANHIVNLPTYPTLTDAQVERVITFTNSYGN